MRKLAGDTPICGPFASKDVGLFNKTGCATANWALGQTQLRDSAGVSKNNNTSFHSSSGKSAHRNQDRASFFFSISAHADSLDGPTRCRFDTVCEPSLPFFFQFDAHQSVARAILEDRLFTHEFVVVVLKLPRQRSSINDFASKCKTMRNQQIADWIGPFLPRCGGPIGLHLVKHCRSKLWRLVGKPVYRLASPVTTKICE